MTTLDPTRPVNCWIHHLYADRDDPTCRGRYILVVIYPDVESMRIAGTTYRKRQGFTEYFSNAGGLFQPCPFASKYDRRKRRWVDTTTAFAGVMRLYREGLTAEVIAHEATHAALHVTRLHDWAQQGGDGVVNLGAHVDEREEAFCYLLGGIASELANVVWRIKDETAEAA